MPGDGPNRLQTVAIACHRLQTLCAEEHKYLRDLGAIRIQKAPNDDRRRDDKVKPVVIVTIANELGAGALRQSGNVRERVASDLIHPAVIGEFQAGSAWILELHGISVNPR